MNGCRYHGPGSILWLRENLETSGLKKNERLALSKLVLSIKCHFRSKIFRLFFLKRCFTNL